MKYTLYKPNSKVTGIGIGFSLSQERDCVYINCISQSGWNPDTKKGSFLGNKENPEKNLSAKLNMDELGGILAALNSFGEWSSFHSFNENKTQFKLGVWDRSSMNKPNAMSFSITRNGSQKFGTFFEAGEVECLKIFLTEATKEVMWNKNQKSEE